MKKLIDIADRPLKAFLLILFLLAVFAGCGDSESDFIRTGTSPVATSSEPTRSIVVESQLATSSRELLPSIVTLTVSGLDAQRAIVFGPVDVAPEPTLQFDVPLSVTEFRIAYRDSTGNVVGVFQTDVPSGGDTFSVIDPDYVELEAFVEALTVTEDDVVLDVSESKDLRVVATLSNGSTAGVGNLVTLSSLDSSVVDILDQRITGAGAGQAEIVASLFNVKTTTRVTVNDFKFGLLSTPDGSTGGNGDSYAISISRDGRYAAFQSNADNLATGNTSFSDVYLVDRADGSVRLLSARFDGSASGKTSDAPRISGDGRFVVFQSDGDLLPEDTNGTRDVYLYDVAQESLQLISVNLEGTGPGNGSSGSFQTSISYDGRFVAFRSAASDLVSNDTNDRFDIFLRDRLEATTELVSIATDGTQANANSDLYVDGISSDGRYVTFYSEATNLDPEVNDDNGTIDAFLRDRTSDTTTLLSRAFGTNQSGNYQSYVTDFLPDNDTLVIFSESTNLTPLTLPKSGQLYRYSISTGVFELLTDDNAGGVLAGDNYEGMLSEDGRFLLFSNANTTFFDPAGEGQVVLRDLSTGEYRVVSAAPGGAAGNGTAFAYRPSITSNGRTLVFDSRATDLAVQAVETEFSQVYATVNPFLD